MVIDTLVSIALGGAVVVGFGLAVALPIWFRRRDKMYLWTMASTMLDAESGARLLLSADHSVLHANLAGRLLWGNKSPLVVFAGRLADDESAVEALERLRSAADACAPERVELALRPVIDTAAEVDGWDGAAGGRGAGSLSLGDAFEWWAVTLRPVPELPGVTLWKAEDVTARRAIEDILVREREDLAEFLYFIPVGVFSSDSAGRFRMVNQRLAEWLGKTPDGLLMEPVEDYVADGVVPEPEGAWRGVLTFRTRSGAVFPALMIQSTYDDGGEIRTRSVIVRGDPADDLDHPASATQGALAAPTSAAMAAGGQQFQWLFNGAPVGLCLIDLEGVVSDCNRAFEKMCGLPRSEVIDKPLQAVLVAEDRRDLDALMQRVAVGETTSAHREVRLGRDGDGETVASLYVGPMGEGQGVDSLIAYFIDATAQRTLEAQFAQAQKMQAMGQLAGGVAHDFNNLLTAMIGFCDLLLLRHGAGDPSFSDLMQIKQNANRAANLVRQLLAFSRKQPLTPRLLDPTDALTEMSHLLRRLLGETVQLQMVHGRDVGAVRVDPGQFDQVIINLAVNARDAMSGGGQLVIRTSSEVRTTPLSRGADHIPPGEYTVISVSDTGAGIPRENLGRIFEPFFSTKTGQVGAGTGLGLSTVYGIIRQTGGFIFVDSVIDKGTTFTIYLPKQDPIEGVASAEGGDESALTADAAGARAESGSKASSQARSRSGASLSAPPHKEEGVPDLSGGGTVLLVEDEDPVRIFAARALRNKGYTVFEARTGEGALDVLEDKAETIDVLVTDMVMPGIDGATLARQVRQDCPRLPVILISGYSEEAARGELTGSVDFHFLPKPFSLTQLAAKVKEVMAENEK